MNVHPVHPLCAKLALSEMFAFMEIRLTKEIGIIKGLEKKCFNWPPFAAAGEASSSAPGGLWTHSAL